MRKFFLTALLGLSVATGAMMAQEIVVKVAPPRAVIEHRPPRPSHGHIWIAGYHRWDGHAYVWVPGRWEVPPRPHAVWVAPRWHHRHDGYLFVEGHWR